MCTAITLKTADFYFGRNLDLEYNYQEEVCITPRNYVFSFHHEASMKQHYAMIGMAYVCDHYPLYYDACNEKGLCMVSLSMEKYTYYKTYRKDMCNLTPFECIPYLLGKCANVHEVKNELQKINIVAESFSASLPLTPLHFMVSDENESIVIKVNYNITLTGNMFLFDPYESIYDDNDEEYIYPIYKSTDTLNIKNIEVYIEIFKDKNGEYRKYKIIDKAYVNLTDYLSEMNLHYKE